MDDEPQRHYLLTALEAELVACWRTLDTETKDTINYIVASSTGQTRQVFDNPVVLQLVSSL